MNRLSSGSRAITVEKLSHELNVFEPEPQNQNSPQPQESHVEGAPP